MPDYFDKYRSPTNTPTATGSDYFDKYRGNTATATPEPDEGSGVLGPVLGVAALGAGAYLMHNTGMLSKFLKGANTVRQQLMLSGLALPKSIAGNVGATVVESMEQGSMNPIKQLFSRQTMSDIASEYKAAGGTSGTIPGVPTPGRAMGAIDQATQNAFMRGGKTADEAATLTFQSPLGKEWGNLGKTLESPEAQLVHPFRRTPFNQFSEGWKAIKDSGPSAQLRGTATNPKTFNAFAAAGAMHGAETSDEQYPASIGLAVALSAKYGLPYALAAIAARKLVGGQGGGGIAGSALPVSEYGVESSLDPTSAFVNPAASRFFK